MSSLIRAVRKNDLNEVKHNISDINAKDVNGDTALIFAVKKPIVNVDILKMLINAGVDLNAQNNDGATALIWAAILNHKEVVKILIDSGADLNVQLQPIPGSTALVLAVAKNHKEIVEMLIKSGANLNIRNRNGKTALDIMKDKEMMKYKDKQKIKELNETQT